MNPRYVARETPFAPLAEPILSLWAAYLHDMTPASAAQKRKRWYEENPAGPGACVVLQAEGAERPIGVQCLMERRHWSGDMALRAAGLAEFAIDPAHRSLGPALSLLKKCLEIGRERYSLVYGLPNTSALSVCKRAGLVHAGDMTRFILPVRLGLVVRRRKTRLLRGLTRPADLALHAVAAARALRHGAPTRWREVRFDDRALGELWHARAPYLTLAERDARALDWRFNLGAGWQVLLASNRVGEPFGYVVWRLAEDFAEVGDFLCRDPDRQSVALLSGFVRRVRRDARVNGIDLEFCGRPAVVQGIRQAGFMPRSVMCPLVLDRGGDARLTEGLYFTRFDRVSD